MMPVSVVVPIESSIILFKSRERSSESFRCIQYKNPALTRSVSGEKSDGCTARVRSCDAVTCAAATAPPVDNVVAAVFVRNDRRVAGVGVLIEGGALEISTLDDVVDTSLVSEDSDVAIVAKDNEGRVDVVLAEGDDNNDV
jgi:hypothetical protein